MMKKFFKFISILLCAVAALALVACSDHGAPDHSVESPSYSVRPDDLASELEAFVTANPNRTTFSDGEQAAAMYLFDRLTELGYEDVSVRDFSVTENNVPNLASRNVVAHLRKTRTSAMRYVIIGAAYDNRYAAAYSGAAYLRADAALMSGTGVAAALQTAKYVMEHANALPTDLDITFVFFGASYITSVGANEYLRDMSADEYKGALLMVEMQRLAGDHIYAFSDAKSSGREGFFDEVAADNGLDIYKITTKTPQNTYGSVLDGVPYFQWAHNGVFPVFYNAGIPTLNLMGANWETMSFADLESAKRDNISYTTDDTLDNLKRFYPDYAEKMATAVSLVTSSLFDDGFIATMQADKASFDADGAAGKMWIWYLVAIGIIVIAVTVMSVCASYIKKKHPITVVAQQPPKVKMAVFGMDYEDKDSSDIFIDLREADNSAEIFPGIKNNAPKNKDPFDDIFPPPGSDNGNKGNDGNSGNNGNGDPPPADPFE